MFTQFYSNTSFDRATSSRKCKVHAARENRKKYIPVWNRHFLYNWDKGKVQFYVSIPREWAVAIKTKVFLGIDEGYEVFCIDISNIKEPAKGNVVLLDLRKIFASLDEREAALLAYAQGIVHWHDTHKYCGKCGCTTSSRDKGHTRICNNVHCGQIHYPRVDPAVITLIEYRESNKPALCLLNLSKSPNGYKCSPFAGFVEIGESLEDTVIRGMKEEVGLHVYNIRYVSSQPWPFPSAIMTGFIAQADTSGFSVDGEEIVEAKWYTANEILEKVQRGELELSNEDSIARSLINHWITGQSENIQ